MVVELKVYKNSSVIMNSLFKSLSYVLILVQITLIVYYWQELPQSIPTHFNGAGVADGWGEKSDILILPILSFIMVGLFYFIKKNALVITPHKWGARNIEELNISKKLMDEMLLFIVLVFTLIIYFSLQIALKISLQLPMGFLFFTLGGLFGILVIYFYRLYKLKKTTT